MANELQSQPATIQRARECTKCGYNLYSLPREGSCPECGHLYKSRKHDAVAKNPRRQLAQLNRLLKKRERELHQMPLWWLAAAIAIVACVMFGAGRFWWSATVFLTLLTLARQFTTVFNRRDTKQKIEAVDARLAD